MSRDAAIREPAPRERHSAGMDGLASERLAPSDCRRVAELVDLVALYEPDVRMVVWDRPVDAGLRAFAAGPLAHEPLQWEAEVDVAALDTVTPVPPAAVARDAAAAAAFTSDVRFLARLFADLVGASRLGVRLARLEAPMCPRFHTDHVGVRLVSTYVGPGSEWLADEHVDRRRLGHRANGAPDATSGLLRPGAVVRQLPEFAVALMKGERWPGGAGRGVVHRSPPECGVRLLLSIDVLAQDDDAAAVPVPGLGIGSSGPAACGGGR